MFKRRFRWKLFSSLAFVEQTELQSQTDTTERLICSVSTKLKDRGASAGSFQNKDQLLVLNLLQTQKGHREKTK